jgi:cardiolipin synthase
LWRHRPFTLNFRNHRKLLVVDGKVAFVGGRNVGDEYFTDRLGNTRPWRDAMAQVEGPAVPRLHRVFVEDWYNAADEVLTGDAYFPDVATAGDDRVGVVATGPDTPDNALPWVLLQMIVSARRTLDISSPYLVPVPVILSALQLVAARGARVRIHTNGRGVEQFILYHAQRSYYRGLLAAGVVILENHESYNHAKMILVDGEQFLVGSPNIDSRSAELNFEIAVVTNGPRACEDAARVFEARLSESRRVTTDDLKHNWFWQAVDGFCRLLSPLL